MSDPTCTAQPSAQPSALVLIADGTEEIEFTCIYEYPSVSSLDPTVPNGSASSSVPASTQSRCSRGVRITPDIADIKSLSPADADATVLLLPGGAPGSKTFCNDEVTLNLVRTFRRTGRLTGFLCAATTVLVTASQEKCRVTSHPSVRAEVEQAGWEYSDDHVVVDGTTVTSRGPGTAIAFALTIVELVLGRARRDEIRGPMMVMS